MLPSFIHAFEDKATRRLTIPLYYVLSNLITFIHLSRLCCRILKAIPLQSLQFCKLSMIFLWLYFRMMR
ncbi:unnamed protein product [Strongylus vulgaris]|uniref:Uncharacterized protein n=1 Tax=Strongylus vulgaris TaxID=40348 RepID=A0A3P7ICD0_STRVU|nr:unnamed protein product [Strongylus vulgaris]